MSLLWVRDRKRALVPCLYVKSLQLIWRSSACRFRLQETDLQIGCSDLNTCQGIRISDLEMATRWYANSCQTVLYFKWCWYKILTNWDLSEGPTVQKKIAPIEMQKASASSHVCLAFHSCLTYQSIEPWQKGKKGLYQDQCESVQWSAYKYLHYNHFC